MENGRFEVLLTSEEMLEEDRWHHLVTVPDRDLIDEAGRGVPRLTR